MKFLSYSLTLLILLSCQSNKITKEDNKIKIKKQNKMLMNVTIGYPKIIK